METQSTIGALTGSLFWGAVKRLIASGRSLTYGLTALPSCVRLLANLLGLVLPSVFASRSQDTWSRYVCCGWVSKSIPEPL